MTAMAVEPADLGTDENAYSVRQVARLFGVPQRRLRYWAQTGFIAPSERRADRVFYNFRDLIAVKVAKALLDTGVPLRRVRRSLAALARRLPAGGASLAGLRVRYLGDEVIVEHSQGDFEAATGQLVLDFEIHKLEAEAAQVVALPWINDEPSGGPTTAYAWFQRGCTLEDDWSGSPVDVEGFEAARHAYEQAIGLDNDLAAAWTNLGSMHAEMGSLDEARQHFEQALRCDPDQPEAHCNLAELGLQAGDYDSAIAAYRQVLHLAPDWIEAHYGLARALLEVGGKAQALAHLERFCVGIEATIEAGIEAGAGAGIESKAGDDACPDPSIVARRDSARAVIAKLERELGRGR